MNFYKKYNKYKKKYLNLKIKLQNGGNTLDEDIETYKFLASQQSNDEERMKYTSILSFLEALKNIDSVDDLGNIKTMCNETNDNNLKKHCKNRISEIVTQDILNLSRNSPPDDKYVLSNLLPMINYMIEAIEGFKNEKLNEIHENVKLIDALLISQNHTNDKIATIERIGTNFGNEEIISFFKNKALEYIEYTSQQTGTKRSQQQKVEPTSVSKSRPVESPAKSKSIPVESSQQQEGETKIYDFETLKENLISNLNNTNNNLDNCLQHLFGENIHEIIDKASKAFGYPETLPFWENQFLYNVVKEEKGSHVYFPDYLLIKREIPGVVTSQYKYHLIGHKANSYNLEFYFRHHLFSSCIYQLYNMGKEYPDELYPILKNDQNYKQFFDYFFDENDKIRKIIKRFGMIYQQLKIFEEKNKDKLFSNSISPIISYLNVITCKLTFIIFKILINNNKINNKFQIENINDRFNINSLIDSNCPQIFKENGQIELVYNLLTQLYAFTESRNSDTTNPFTD